MCGIAGTVGAQAPAIVARMLDALAHRGPDGVASFAGNGVALGHRRLAIIDLDDRAAQPMTRGQYTIVFNGEIYNYAELRKELEAGGEHFSTTSDTEVLLCGFARYGMVFVPRLRGMFAFAVWDEIAGELVLVRDRFGIKPLYFSNRDGHFSFASEVRALLGNVPRVVDTQAVFDYWQYGSVRGERTIARDVRAVAPGAAIVVKDGQLSVRRWYDFAAAVARCGTSTYAEARMQLRAHLEQAARYHLVADVPVGAFLSAGIDSTAMVALLAGASTQPIETFTLGFEDASSVVDERAIARTTAARYGTHHHELVVVEHEVPSILERFLGSLDMPSADGANTFLIAGFAARHVKVAVSGLAGDELFAGYPHFARLERLKKLPRILPHFFASGFGRLKMRLPRRAAQLLDELSLSPQKRLDTLRRLADDGEARAWLAATPHAAAIEDAAIADGFAGATRTSVHELTTYMVDTLLRDSDVMSMASGLELRPLLLDHPLVEWTVAQPDVHKITKAGPKRIFIDAIRDLLPEEVVSRRKTGFELPLGRWLRTSLRDRAREAFASQHARNLLSNDGLNLLQRSISDGDLLPPRIWPWFVLFDYLTRNGFDVAPTS